MNDLVQALIDAGAIPSSPFGESSRYLGVPLAVLERPDGTRVAYVKRRFIPPRRDYAAAAVHTTQSGERPDLLAHRYYAQALLYWHIVDANGLIDPLELTTEPGGRILVPVPPAVR
jgi:hypothetical protein